MPHTDDKFFAWSNLWLRLNAELEPGFKAFYEAELLIRLRWAALAAGVVMSAYLVMDIFLIPREILAQFLLLRFWLVILPLSLGWYATFLPRWQPYIQPLFCAIAISVGLTITALVCLAQRNGTPIDYEGLILTLFYFYCCGGLRLKSALIAGSVVGLVYPLADSWAGLNHYQVMIRTLFLWTANIIGVVSCCILESAARRNYLMTQQLNALANQDFLTGLLNRRAFADRLPVLWRSALREQESIHLAMLDVDFFKRYNDRYGHLAGDEVLRQVGQVLLRSSQRPLDACARFGGEEFICLWYGGSRESVEKIVQAIHAQIRGLQIAHTDSPAADTLTVSIGLIHVLPTSQIDVTGLLQAADAALYQAKANGRNSSVSRHYCLPV